MRKFSKKLSAFLLTGVLLVGMCFPAMAASTSTGSSSPLTAGATATVTVGVSGNDGQSANGGDRLLAYKVVDITYNAAGNVLSYEFTQLFKNFLASDSGAAYASLTPAGYGEYANNSDELKNLLGSFTSYVKNRHQTELVNAEADSNGVATFANMEMGQYIIVGDGTSTGAKIYQTVTAEVEPEIVDGSYVLYSDYTVAMKTTQPELNKDIVGGTVEDNTGVTNQGEGDKHTEHKDTASVGDTVNYEIKVTIPTYPAGATNKTFYVGDKLSGGLDLKADTIKVTAYPGEVELTKGEAYKVPDPTITSDANGVKTETQLYVDFAFDSIKGYDYVIISYDADLNANAVIGTAAGEGVVPGNPNNAELIYSNSPFDGSSYETGDRPTDQPGYGKDEDLETVFTYALVIDKFEEKHEDEKLSGAVFEIYDNAEGTGNPIATITTDANGAAVYKGLKKGTYWLKETVAPTGFNLMDTMVEITIDATQIPYYTESNKTVTHYTYKVMEEGDSQATLNGDLVWMNSNGDVKTGATAPEEGYVAASVASTKETVESVIEINKDVTGANGYYKAGIANSTGAHLPSTGGMGTTLFTVVGLILMLGAALVLVTRRRMAVRK